ncbi:MAG: hypothetical protein NVSMB65_10420 [Chloroflexota bacterium]
MDVLEAGVQWEGWRCACVRRQDRERWRQVEYHIRRATDSDDEALCALYAEGDQWHHDALPDVFGPPAVPARSRAYVAERMSGDDATLLVADAGALVGLVEVYAYDGPDHPSMIPRRLASIMTIIVARAHQRRGIGHALMQTAEAWARGRGARRIRLNVWDVNTGAITFYEELGFRTLRHAMEKVLPDPET